jgi:plasmid maintenance system antidote protein VapI
VGILYVAPVDSAQELRAEVARRLITIYQLAAKVGLHPSHLGQLLRGRRPLTPEMASRIRAALAETAPDGPTPHAGA